MRAQDIILSLYGRGNFPGHRVLQKQQKNMHGALRMGAHGLEWVRLDAFIRGESKNKRKRGTNGRAGRVFECTSAAKNKNKVSKCGRG